MLKYLVRRIVGMIVVMFIVLTVVFVIVRIAPGDPAALMLGPDATPEEAMDLREKMGLNRPILIQYVGFMAQVVRGDLGSSLFFDLPVTSILAQRAEPTIFLTLFSLIIAVSIAVPVGIYAAYRRNSLFD